jgi:hypothetical protein
MYRIKLFIDQTDVAKGKAFLASPNLKSSKGKSGLRPRVSSSFRTEGPKDFREQFERLKVRFFRITKLLILIRDFILLLIWPFLETETIILRKVTL